MLSDGEEEVARDVVHVVLREADLQTNVSERHALQDEVARLEEGSRRYRGRRRAGVTQTSAGDRAAKQHGHTDGVLHSRAAEAKAARSNGHGVLDSQVGHSHLSPAVHRSFIIQGYT